jgi:uncharacterized integral membrane protein (TIGR00697 family)
MGEDDILSGLQYYDLQTAKSAINLAIAAFVVLFIAMFFTIHFPVVSLIDQQAAGVDNQQSIQEAMKTLFSPAPKLFLCSMISFWISQRLEIMIFGRMRTWLGEKNLWLRNNVSTWVAALGDNTIFSVLMWRFFADEPVSWHVLIMGYILGTYLLRVLMAILDTPMIYLAKFCLPKAESDGAQIKGDQK